MSFLTRAFYKRKNIENENNHYLPYSLKASLNILLIKKGLLNIFS